jgi:hypothetical protein
MRVLVRSGSLLLALAVVLTGCNQSGDSPPKGAPPSKTALTSATPQADDATLASGSECVLSLQGMV